MESSDKTCLHQNKKQQEGPQGGPGSRELGFALSLGFQRCLDLRHLRGWSSSVGSLGPSRLSTHFLLQNRLSRVLFSSTGGPGPAGSGQRTLHPRVFVFCFWGPGPNAHPPQSQRAGAHLPIHQPRSARVRPGWRGSRDARPGVSSLRRTAACVLFVTSSSLLLVSCACGDAATSLRRPRTEFHDRSGPLG